MFQFRQRNFTLALVSFSLLMVVSEQCQGGDASVSLKSGVLVPAHTPIFVNDENGTMDDFELIETRTGIRYPLQKSGDQWVTLSPRDLAAGETVTCEIVPGTEQHATLAPILSCDEEEGCLVLRNRGREVLRYRIDTVEPPSGQDKLYRRSGYIHPLYTPRGALITGDFAADHPHQHGVMFAWTNTTFAGRKVDFWNQAAGQGLIEHREVLRTLAGPVFAEFVVKLAHVDLTSGQPIDALEEEWTVRVYDGGDDVDSAESPGNPSYIIDFESIQRAASDEPLKVKEYHYGGFAIRGNEAWLGTRNDLFTTSEKKHRLEGNHSRPTWVEMAGPLEASPEAAIVILAHQNNFRPPAPVRLHPAKPYFCFAPLVLGDFEITRTQPLHSRYRLVVSDGSRGAETTEQLLHSFSEPPVLQAK